MSLTRISVERAHRTWLETVVTDNGSVAGSRSRFKVMERLFVEDEFDMADRKLREKSSIFPVMMIEYDNESEFAKRAIAHFQKIRQKGCRHLSWASSGIG